MMMITEQAPSNLEIYFVSHQYSKPKYDLFQNVNKTMELVRFETTETQIFIKSDNFLNGVIIYSTTPAATLQKPVDNESITFQTEFKGFPPEHKHVVKLLLFKSDKMITGVVAKGRLLQEISVVKLYMSKKELDADFKPKASQLIYLLYIGAPVLALILILTTVLIVIFACKCKKKARNRKKIGSASNISANKQTYVGQDTESKRLSLDVSPLNLGGATANFRDSTFASGQNNEPNAVQFQSANINVGAMGSELPTTNQQNAYPQPVFLNNNPGNPQMCNDLPFAMPSQLMQNVQLMPNQPGMPSQITQQNGVKVMYVMQQNPMLQNQMQHNPMLQNPMLQNPLQQNSMLDSPNFQMMQNNFQLPFPNAGVRNPSGFGSLGGSDPLTGVSNNSTRRGSTNGSLMNPISGISGAMSGFVSAPMKNDLGMVGAMEMPKESEIEMFEVNLDAMQNYEAGGKFK